MSSPLLRVASAILALAFLGRASAFGIDTVNGGTGDVSGALGTVLTIDGSGFGGTTGTAKPKVFLDFDGKLYALKVTAFTDTQITAQIKKGQLGSHLLRVRPKGSTEDFTYLSILLQAPVIDQLLDELQQGVIDEASPAMPFVITGDFFGSLKKPKIKIGGKKAKVVEWAMNQILLEMPKKLANGLWDIELLTKIGVDNDEQITMFDSPLKLGKLGLNLFIGGVKVNLGLGGAVIPPGFGVVAIGTSGTNPAKTLIIAVPFADGSNLPEQYVFGTDLMIVSYAVIGTQVQNIYASNDGFVVNITKNSGGQVGGDFSGSMDDQVGGGGTIQVTGDFIVDVLDL